MAHPDSQPDSFSPARRFGIALNVALSGLALVAVVGMVNYLAARHFHRFLWGADERYRLSLPTRQVLGALTNEAKVTVLFSRDSALFSPVAGLLKEYAYLCPRLKVETIDYRRDLALAQTTIERLQLSPNEADLVVFEIGGRTRIVRSAELSEYNLADLLAGQKEIKRIGFKGESLFTDALASLLEGKSPKSYFLQGHGEHDPASLEANAGYAQFARLLQQKNVAVATLRLGGDAEIPDDCQLLVIAGPRSRFDPSELDKINRYLNDGGRLLALLGLYQPARGPTGLERLLGGWGVVVGDNYTFDLRQAVGGGILATNFANHPIVRPLRQHTLYIGVARSVDAAQVTGQSADAPRVEPLVRTSVEGYTASDLGDGGSPRFNPTRDRRGAVPLAVAVDKGSLQGVTADRGSTRLVVAGDSLFLANDIIKSAANVEFATLAVNWLLDRPQHLAGIAAQPIREYSVLLAHAQLVQLRWLLLLVLPGAPLAVGWLVWMRRRR